MVASLVSGGILSKLGSWVGDYFTRRQQAKQTELELNMKLKEAKTNAQINLYNTGLVGDIAWEKAAQDNAGWKDEFLVIVFSLPLIGGFIPGLDKYILNGFHSFDAMPDWYQASVGVIVASVFGIKKFSEFMSMRKGINLSRLDEIKSLLEENNKKDK